MKPILHFTRPLALAVLVAGLAGCVSSRLVTPVADGYEEVAHPTAASMSRPESTRFSFQYRSPNGRTTPIWPSLYGVNEVVKDNLAIFVGDVTYVHSDDENDPRGTQPRLFAVECPALPLDITDQVLWRWAKASGKDFRKTLGLYSMVTPGGNENGLYLQLEFWTQERDWPDKIIYRLDWNQVSDIMREVKEKGTVHKELHWGTRYIRQEL